MRVLLPELERKVSSSTHAFELLTDLAQILFLAIIQNSHSDILLVSFVA